MAVTSDLFSILDFSSIILHLNFTVAKVQELMGNKNKWDRRTRNGTDRDKMGRTDYFLHAIRLERNVNKAISEKTMKYKKTVSNNVSCIACRDENGKEESHDTTLFWLLTKKESN